jgi:hypothetical protein
MVRLASPVPAGMTMRMHSLKSPSLMLAIVAVVAVMPACATTARPAEPVEIVWTLREVANVAGLTTEVVGAPTVSGSGMDSAILFDGKGDGLFVPHNPLAGWPAFTIQARFKPDGSGGEEQRFLHMEDQLKHRVLLETRVTPAKQWALDTFLFQDADNKLTLLDRRLLHPTDRWYWVALVYDGRQMSHYIDGVLELQGDVAFMPMSAGRTSLGVRQNLVSWFKGAISEVRFAPGALRADQLRR